MSYLEMKYNLLMSYCTFLSFYLLLKVEGKAVEDHPVIGRLTHIKTLFEKLKPLDQKLQYQIDKMIRLANLGDTSSIAVSKAHLSHKPNLAELDQASDEEMELSEAEMGEDELSEADSLIEDDMHPTTTSKAKNKAKQAPFSDDSSEEDTAKNTLYKAPKMTSVAFGEDKQSRKSKRDDREKARLGQTGLLQDLQRELGDAPEQVYMGGAL